MTTPANRSAPRRHVRCRSSPAAAAASSGSQRFIDAREDDLRFRIAQPYVELDDLRTGRGQHQADVEKSAERLAFSGHAGDHRLDDLARHARLERGVHQRARRERAHAAGIRPAVVVEDALVILRGTDRQRAFAVADEERGDLGSGEALLDHQTIAGGPEATLAHRCGDRRLRRRSILGDDDALAGSQSVGLQHEREAERARAHHRQRFVEGVGGMKTRRRHAVTCHERLGEGLARFERRRGARGTEQQTPARGEAVGDANAQRQLGADDREVDAFADGEREQRVRVGEIGVDRSARPRAIPGIAGRARQRQPRRGCRGESGCRGACSRAPPPSTRIFMICGRMTAVNL